MIIGLGHQGEGRTELLEEQTMRLLIVASSIFAVAQASLLTVSLQPDETSCFYVFADKPQVNVNYYFAVQSGGSFDIDYAVRGPDKKVIAQDEKQRQGEWSFVADTAGEYELCLSNRMSTFSEKVVDFQFTTDSDVQAGFNFGHLADETINEVSESVEHIRDQVNHVMKSLQYYRTRSHRNHATVKSTLSRIYTFSLYEILFCLGMALLQVIVVELFFRFRVKDFEV